MITTESFKSCDVFNVRLEPSTTRHGRSSLTQRHGCRKSVGIDLRRPSRRGRTRAKLSSGGSSHSANGGSATGHALFDDYPRHLDPTPHTPAIAPSPREGKGPGGDVCANTIKFRAAQNRRLSSPFNRIPKIAHVRCGRLAAAAAAAAAPGLASGVQQCRLTPVQ